MKAQSIDRNTLPWKSPFQPYTAWIGFVGATILTFVCGFPVFLKGNWDTQKFVASYVGIPIFVGLAIMWKMTYQTKVRLLKRLYHK